MPLNSLVTPKGLFRGISAQAYHTMLHRFDSATDFTVVGVVYDIEDIYTNRNILSLKKMSGR